MIVERRIKNQAVRIECAESYALMAENVLEVFERRAASGTKMEPNAKIRFGWSLFSLAPEGMALRVMEPEFTQWPMQRWHHTIDRSLQTLALQVGLMHKLKIDGADVGFDQAIIAAPGALHQSKIFLRRADSVSEQDSGWLLGTQDDPQAITRSEKLDSIWIANLVQLRPALLQALTLPTGYIALFADNELERIFDPQGQLLFPCDKSSGKN